MDKIARKRNRDGVPKGGIIQFRADEDLVTELTQIAEKLRMPVGALARLWVSERLEKEQSHDISSLKQWRDNRESAIQTIIQTNFDPAPIQVLHLIPYQRTLSIEPEEMSRVFNLLPPVERAGDYQGRINIDGYETIKQFKIRQRWSGYTQLFDGGQIESIRELRTDDENNIFADRLDEDFIRAVWSYSCALETLGVKPPVALFASFKNMKGLKLKSSRIKGVSDEMTLEEFQVSALTIKDWKSVTTIESAAHTVKKFLDRIANSAGLPRSLSYSVSGDWVGLSDLKAENFGVARLGPRTEVISLSGINPDTKREDLLLHDDGKEILIGKVRKPYLEPTAETSFKCFVYENEMAPDAKKLLETLLKSKSICFFSVGQIRFAGRITRITEGYAGGTLHGLNAPPGLPLLLFDVSPF